MDEKNFETRVLDAVSNNIFAVKKLLFNLEDCVPKKDFDATQTSIAELRLKNSSLLAERDDLRAELIRQKKSLRQTSAEISALKNELLDRVAELERSRERVAALTAELVKKSARLDEFEATYSELEQAFSAYKKLSDTTKFALEGVFGAESSPTNFLAGILQDGHLESLFDYVATALNSRNNPSELEILRELFNFAFDAVNNGRREKIFARFDVQTGDHFNSNTMRKTSDSAQSGTVQKILLVGYKYIRTSKTVKPSLISLG